MAHYIIGNIVTIGKRTFRRTHSIEIERSVSELKDKATITLPLARGLVNPDNPKDTVATWLKEGEAVSISLSYEKLGKIFESQEFTGFVQRVHPTIPARIECQDSTWAMERTPLNESFSKTSVKKVVKLLLDKVNAKFGIELKVAFEIQDIPIEKPFRASNTNCLYALDQLRKNYGLQAMFTGNTLYVGLAFTRLSQTKDVVINLGDNVIDHDLVYTDDQSQKLKINAIGFTPKGKQIRVSVPEGIVNPDRELTITCTHRIEREPLKNWAKAQLEKKRFDGYTGSFNLFLIPQVNPNDTAVIIDPFSGNRSGRYLVESIKLIKQNGIRRTVTIGKKLD